MRSPLLDLVPESQPDLRARFGELLTAIAALSEADGAANAEDADFDPAPLEAPIVRVMQDDAFAAFLADFVLAYHRPMRSRGPLDPLQAVPQDLACWNSLLSAVMHARPSVVQGALERLVGELVEDKARSALAELRYAPSPAVRERVIEYFRTFLDSPCLAWSEGLGLGLPADHAWSIAVGLSTLSKKDASSRHKRGEEYRLHLRIDYPPLFLPHTVEPLEIAWSASLSGPEPWSGSWTDAAPEAPLVDASQRMRPRKHPMSATLVGLPALVAAIGATMAKTFHVGEATISAGDVSRTAEVRANADEIRMKVRTWLASP